MNKYDVYVTMLTERVSKIEDGELVNICTKGFHRNYNPGLTIEKEDFNVFKAEVLHEAFPYLKHDGKFITLEKVIEQFISDVCEDIKNEEEVKKEEKEMKLTELVMVKSIEELGCLLKLNHCKREDIELIKEYLNVLLKVYDYDNELFVINFNLIKNKMYKFIYDELLPREGKLEFNKIAFTITEWVSFTENKIEEFQKANLESFKCKDIEEGVCEDEESFLEKKEEYAVMLYKMFRESHRFYRKTVLMIVDAFKESYFRVYDVINVVKYHLYETCYDIIGEGDNLDAAIDIINQFIDILYQHKESEEDGDFEYEYREEIEFAYIKETYMFKLAEMLRESGIKVNIIIGVVDLFYDIFQDYHLGTIDLYRKWELDDLREELRQMLLITFNTVYTMNEFNSDVLTLYKKGNAVIDEFISWMIIENYNREESKHAR